MKTNQNSREVDNIQVHKSNDFASNLAVILAVLITLTAIFLLPG
ncbi:hypothetical protein SAMN04488096_102128 [Mesonia phycicola]|uniref:Uncharacterized protein n=1 Tax=Mesonia phycicola TaxID=579105 RepID=A0A1M6BMH2_9FLAO|nr:hypothetical protein [Mesonia phycicola]SHI49925.1 hypothetical protein SAMN04488096_102128 [Mesonia phycicola]